MKFVTLFSTSLIVIFAYFANASDSQQETKPSLLDLQSAADVRSYFERLANAKTDAELLQQYRRLLKDLGIAPLISKGNTIPIRNGGQLLVDGNLLTARDKNGDTTPIPADGPAIAALAESGSWLKIEVPDKTTELLIRTKSGALIVDLDDAVVSRVFTSRD